MPTNTPIPVIARPCATIRGSAVAALIAATAILGACADAAPAGSADGAALTTSLLASPAGPGSGEPNLAVDANGEVYLSWLEPAGEAHELRFSKLDGDEWTAPVTIARGTDWFVNWADFPSIIRLPDGRLAAHYLQRNPDAEVGYHYDIRIVQSADGGATWSDPIEPHRGGVPAEHGFVSMFDGPGDSIGAIWLDGRKSDAQYGGTGEMTLRYTTIAPDGGLGREVEVDGRICDCCQTSVDHAAAGPVAVYRDRTEAEIRDIYVTRMVDGEWTEGAPVHRDAWEIAACPVNGPSISADGDAIAVAWFTAARDTPRVNVAFSSDGGATFGPPTRVDDGAPAGRVDVELLDDGSALVSWLERGAGDEADVRVRIVGRDGDSRAPVSLARSSEARSSGFPRMVRAGERIIAAWTVTGDDGGVRTAEIRMEAER